MRWKLSRQPETHPELAEIVFLIQGIGNILMAIDAKLETIVENVDGGDDDGN